MIIEIIKVIIILAVAFTAFKVLFAIFKEMFGFFLIIFGGFGILEHHQYWMAIFVIWGLIIID